MKVTLLVLLVLSSFGALADCFEDIQVERLELKKNAIKVKSYNSMVAFVGQTELLVKDAQEKCDTRELGSLQNLSKYPNKLLFCGKARLSKVGSSQGDLAEYIAYSDLLVGGDTKELCSAVRECIKQIDDSSKIEVLEKQQFSEHNCI